MNRDEYMRLKGELITATEAFQQARIDKRRAHESLQGWLNGLHSSKVSVEIATEAHDLIDRLLATQQQESEWDARARQYKQMLNGVPVPD